MAIKQPKICSKSKKLDLLQTELQQAEEELCKAQKALKEEGLAAPLSEYNKNKKAKDSITVAAIALGCFVAMMWSDFLHISIIVVYLFLMAYEIYIAFSFRNERVAKKISACKKSEKQVYRLKRKIKALGKENENGRS